MGTLTCITALFCLGIANKIGQFCYFGPVQTRLGACARALYPATEKDVVQAPWCPRSNHDSIRQFSARHFVCCRGKSVGTDKIIFRPVFAPRNGARVLPLDVAPVSMSGAQVFARAPTISYIPTSTRAQEPGTGA